MSFDGSDSGSDSLVITIKGNDRVFSNISANMSVESLDNSIDSHESTFKGRCSISLKSKNSRRCRRVSDVRQASSYSRESPRRERSRTQDPMVVNCRNKTSPWVVSRLSMPGGSGLRPPVYFDADAWITDSITENPASTKKNEGQWVHKKSKGPFFGSYQLLGDSLFVRFADQILKSPAVIGENGKFCNGYCVSGQTIMDLDRRISKDFTTTDVIVLIGTNDFLRKSYCHAMKNEMKSLISFLSYCAKKIVILTLPPIPRLDKTVGYWNQWESYNEWLKSLDNGKTIKVIDIAPLFMLKARTPDMSVFESHMGYGDKKRVDHIHLNKLGLLKLYREIKKQLNID